MIRIWGSSGCNTDPRNSAPQNSAPQKHEAQSQGLQNHGIKNHGSKNHTPRNRGFTLVELMVVLAVAGIIVTYLVPSFRAFINNSSLSTNMHTMISSFNYARSEAVARGNQVVVCSSDNQASCSGSWSDGWIIFEDIDRDNVMDDGELLRALPPLTGKTIFDNGMTRVSFRSNGFSDTNTQALVVCDSRGYDKYARALLVEPSGQVHATLASESGLDATFLENAKKTCDEN